MRLLVSLAVTSKLDLVVASPSGTACKRCLVFPMIWIRWKCAPKQRLKWLKTAGRMSDPTPKKVERNVNIAKMATEESVRPIAIDVLEWTPSSAGRRKNGKSVRQRPSVSVVENRLAMKKKLSTVYIKLWARSSIAVTFPSLILRQLVRFRHQKKWLPLQLTKYEVEAHGRLKNDGWTNVARS